MQWKCIQIINFHGLFRNALRCRKLVPVEYPLQYTSFAIYIKVLFHLWLWKQHNMKTILTLLQEKIRNVITHSLVHVHVLYMYNDSNPMALSTVPIETETDFPPHAVQPRELWHHSNIDNSTYQQGKMQDVWKMTQICDNRTNRCDVGSLYWDSNPTHLTWNSDLFHSTIVRKQINLISSIGGAKFMTVIHWSCKGITMGWHTFKKPQSSNDIWFADHRTGRQIPSLSKYVILICCLFLCLEA